MMGYPLDMGCTVARHRELGVHAVVNARAGQQHLNDLSIEDIELRRDARRIRDRIERRVILRQVCSRFFRRNRHRIEHLLEEGGAS